MSEGMATLSEMEYTYARHFTAVDHDTLHDLVISTYRPKRMKEIDSVTMSRDLLLFRPS